jgi:ABC transport system ATP-binding/permease protein
MQTITGSILNANELVLSHGFEQLLDGVSFQVEAGQKVGLVGRNGCGKTSLLKLLTGAEVPDSGTVTVAKGVRVGYLPQEFDLKDARTVAENIQSGSADVMEWRRRYEAGEGSDTELADLLDHIEIADGWNLEHRIKNASAALSVPPLDSLVGPLSGGEKRRVALCRAIISQPDLLLLDEPTNHLDADSIGWLEEFLKNFKGAVIFVTHDRYFLDVIATRMIELDQGQVFSHEGNYTAYLESKAIRQQIAEQSERRRQRFLRVELEWVKAGVRAQRSKSRHRLDTFYETQGLEAPTEERDLDVLIPPAPELGGRAIELHHCGAKVGDGEAERWLFQNLDLEIQRGTCTGIVGRNGVGKTTLLRMCIGERSADQGTVKIGAKVQVNHIDQSRMQLDRNATVMAEISSDEMVMWGNRQLSTRGYLKRFLFSDDRIGQKVDRLSGGEQARLMLAKVLRHGGNVLVLDEPTNDLDLPSLRMLENAIANFDGIVLVVSHDRYFLDRICDQIVAFEPDGLHVQPGNYSYYLEKRKERQARLANQAEFTASRIRKTDPDTKVKPEAARRLSYKEQQELAGMEELILKRESEAEEVEKALSDPDFYAKRAEEAGKLAAELEVMRADIAGLYSRWEELEAVGSQ